MLSPTPAAAALTPAAYARPDIPASRDGAGASAPSQAVRVTSISTSITLDGLKAAAAQAAAGPSSAEMASATGSIPAALGRMRDLVMMAGNPALSDSDRATLQAEYVQLRNQLDSLVGSTAASENAQFLNDQSGRDRGDSGGESSSSDGQSSSGRDRSSPDPSSARGTVVRARVGGRTVDRGGPGGNGAGGGGTVPDPTLGAPLRGMLRGGTGQVAAHFQAAVTPASHQLSVRA